VPEHRERPRLGGRGADAHHDPAGDEDAAARRNRGHHGAGAEDGDTAQHHLLPPEQVAEFIVPMCTPGWTETGKFYDYRTRTLMDFRSPE